MRFLFVSDSITGGSGRSQRELASHLRAAGHDVRILVDPGTRSAVVRWVHEQLSDAAARFDGSRVARLLAALGTLPGRRTVRSDLDGVHHETSPIVANAVPSLVRSYLPDVVVGSSISTLGWRTVRACCQRTGIPTVLYVREASALGHFDRGVAPGDLLLANAAALAEQVRGSGFECEVVPSLVDVEVTRCTTTRSVVLAVNPVESRGVALVWALAERLPHLRFVLQESWPLDPDELARIERRRSALPNVELRRVEPAGPHLYRDARVLLVPYLDGDRPRVVLEAQANGIPVVAVSTPALVDAVGSGGWCLPAEDLDAWCGALELLWGDDATYEALSRAAVAHARRPEVAPPAIVDRFVRLVSDIVVAGRPLTAP